MSKRVTDFEVIDHGIENEQYFQGCGIACTDFTDIATGCGCDVKEAFDDALESLAQNDWDTAELEHRIVTAKLIEPTDETTANDPEDTDRHYYVSIRVK